VFFGVIIFVVVILSISGLFNFDKVPDDDEEEEEEEEEEDVVLYSELILLVSSAISRSGLLIAFVVVVVVLAVANKPSTLEDPDRLLATALLLLLLLLLLLPNAALVRSRQQYLVSIPSAPRKLSKTFITARASMRALTLQAPRFLVTIFPINIIIIDKLVRRIPSALFLFESRPSPGNVRIGRILPAAQELIQEIDLSIFLDTDLGQCKGQKQTKRKHGDCFSVALLLFLSRRAYFFFDLLNEADRLKP
jgi:hypothetical protein